MERPLFPPLLGLIAGITVAGLLQVIVPVWSLPLLLALSVPAALVGSRKLFLSIILLLCFSAGNLSIKPYLKTETADHPLARFVSRQAVTVEGVIASRPEFTGKGGKLIMHTEKVVDNGLAVPVTGLLLLHVHGGMPAVLTGDRISAVARLQTPKLLGLPGEYDYPGQLAFRGIRFTGSVKDGSGIVLLRSAVAFPVQRIIDGLAARLGSFIGQAVPGEEGRILRALLLGERGVVSKETADAYTLTGINHILSISGFHVGIISLFLFQVILRVAGCSERLLLRFNLRRSALILTLPVIIFYMFLTVAAPATVRSVIMIAVFVSGLALDREVDPVNSLMLAALIILAITPPALFDISFQLSFLALWGILVLTPLLMKPFAGMREGVGKKCLLFLMVSVSATLATAIPVAYYFHRVSATGLIANFIAVPLIGYGAVVAGFSALPFVLFAPSVADLLLALAAFFVKVADLAIVRLAAIPTLPVWTPDRFHILASCLLLMSLTFVRSKGYRLACCGLLTVWLAGAGLVKAGDGDGGKLRIDFLSVGQGESTLITFPDGRKMLVDGGGRLWEGGSDVGERLLAPALRKLGVRRLDFVTLSHPHPDHMQGLLHIVEHFPVGEFWESGASSRSRDYAVLKETVARKQIPVRTFIKDSTPVDIGGVEITPLAPARSAGNPEDEIDLNDDSLVFRLDYHGFSMLFTGDIGFAAEEPLLLDPGSVRCTVLKVPHHGSRYSLSDPFLRAAAPKIALISAGAGNRFGLPATDTVEQLRRKGVQLFRTDLDGSITIVSSGNGCTVSSFKQNCIP